MIDCLCCWFNVMWRIRWCFLWKSHTHTHISNSWMDDEACRRPSGGLQVNQNSLTAAGLQLRASCHTDPHWQSSAHTHSHTHDTEHCRTKYRITLHTEAFWNLFHVPAAVDYFLHWSFCRVGLWNVRKWLKTCGSVFPQNQNWRLQMSCLVHSSKRKERNQEVFTLKQPEPENPDFFL